MTRRHTTKGNGTEGKMPQKEKSPNTFKALGSSPKATSSRKGFPSKGNQPKGNVDGKPKGACFNCNEVGHYSKNCPKPKLRDGGSKIIALTANLAQGECNCFIFLKGKFSKRDVLCLVDIVASHNFITQESAERMELSLVKLKAPIEVHFANGAPHPTTL